MLFLARHVKATLFGLEPEDIATLLQERNALLNSVKEGVVAINKDAEITLINTESEFCLLRQEYLIHTHF